MKLPCRARWFTCGIALLLAGPAPGAETYRQVVGGTAIYIGVMPAEVVRGHAPEHAERGMHGGAPPGENHLVVALFDAGTGRRVTDAEVTATISGTGLDRVEKRLEPMTIAGAVSYGNYFYMTGAGPYRIELRILRGRAAGAIRARFEWKRS